LDQRIPPASESPEIDRLIGVLNRMMDRLQVSFEQAIRFSADASHELKTPLAIMQGELENALQTATPGTPHQKLLTNLLEETQRMKNTLRSLLLLAQADAGRIPLSAEHFNLAEELNAILEDTRVICHDHSLAIEVSIVPEATVCADRGLIRMAILNLLDNAVKYNEAGGKISVHLTNENRRAFLRVGNTGPGISPADQPRVFGRFFRGTAAGHVQKQGSGLGLSLAREIAVAHGGDLRLVESRAGWTCFELVLPLEES
ncbi:MAG: HAMP domain-containing histidine kinase, partial [Verrucomicrobiae bacterium]|nr:HAMP domain-containing histidine kinase [Verrucomicrobiae bacterium]